MTGTVAGLRDARILVLNWRDIRHPLAGGAEQYMHEIGRRWVGAGAAVTWFTAAADGQPARDRLDGMRVLRAGGPLSVYAQTAVRLLRTHDHFDAVVDCQNGIPFFAPLFAGREVPVVQVVHHVHQDQFATRFSAPMAAVGRLLEGPLARRVYADRPVAAVSPSTRTELRRRLRFTGPVHVVPNGTVPPAVAGGGRAAVPTVVVVSRLVPHKRIDLLLEHVATAAGRFPGLRVEIAGDGPDRRRLQGLAADLGLQSTVRFHGRVTDEVRDTLLDQAWLTTSTSVAEGWGCSVIEAAAWGVPCLALQAPGIRDSVLAEETGWLVDRPADFGAALVAAIEQLADPERARTITSACRDWAACFSWDRSADLLASVVLSEMGRVTVRRSGRELDRRSARSDMAVLARFRRTSANAVRAAVRVTDEVVDEGDLTSVVLTGCDEFDAPAVLNRIGARGVSLRLVDRRLLLAGPTGSRLPRVDIPPVGTGRIA
ncbi:Glycosyltransferase involved in cell wall bisynthesis [Geodermatophilus africanus]|uniref:Glycosyltransferase involved in cell wall bisynthesis n=1 Tax=Geodermatophilus africanus TaxID=1137993 RepID=A0A1H3Q610_9ACTN|nr:glycosyltransferase family 4 protein [Geodermatophilus africanus]SDZ08558.1 Glycosyltransferase involved in cell wall bisynthesis [Geodermatophilus africanus]